MVALTLAIVTVGVAVLAFGTETAVETLSQSAATSASATASAVTLAMRAGQPDLAIAAVEAASAVVLRRDGTTAFGERETTTRAAVATRACTATDPIARAWLALESARLGKSRCDFGAAPDPSTSTARPSFTLPPSIPDTWTEGGVVYAAAPVPADATCAPCHGAETAQRNLGTVVVSRPAPRDAFIPSALLGATVLLISLVSAAVISAADTRARKAAIFGSPR